LTLRGVKPPVWRRVLVPSSWTLGELSPALEAVMGWYGGHLHSFDPGDVVYGEPDPDWGDDLQDEREVRVGDVLSHAGTKMRWDYDFGDGWEHDVVVEAILEPDPTLRYPHCVTGRRACPPEDCGGPYGYRDLLGALADPSHPDHEELKEWAPPGFDPARFDVREVNEALRQL
jgi:hypothetical protein